MDPVEDAVRETVAARPEQVRRWLRAEPGAWGRLAGEGVLALRRRLGRRLTETERRRLWTALWTALERLRD